MAADMGFCRVPVWEDLNLYTVWTVKDVLSFGGQNGAIQSAVDGRRISKCLEWR